MIQSPEYADQMTGPTSEPKREVQIRVKKPRRSGGQNTHLVPFFPSVASLGTGILWTHWKHHCSCASNGSTWHH